MTAKFDFTEKLAAMIEAALEQAGRDDIEVIINPDDDFDDFGDATDDSISFRLPDRSISRFRVQSGPYGLGINEDLFTESGEFYGIRNGRMFEVTMLTAATAEALETIQREHAPALQRAPGR